MPKCRFCLTISLIFSTFSSVFNVEGHHGLLSTTSSQPSINHLCHSVTLVHDITLLLYIFFSSWKYSVWVCFSFARNVRFTHCSTFILVMNPAEQHNTVTLKAQRQTNWYREMSSVFFNSRIFKVDYLSLAPHPNKFPWLSAHSAII
jgi:hypothetical protein